MFLDKNEAKCFLLINHTRKAIHHHHHDHHHHRHHYHDLNENACEVEKCKNAVAAIRGFKEIILTKKQSIIWIVCH